MDEKRGQPLARDEVLAALPGYVLGALEPEETRAIDEYLRRHPDMLARMHELDSAATSLALDAPDRPIPAGMKQRIMQRAQSSLQTQRPALSARMRRRPASTPVAEGRPAAQNEPFDVRVRRWRAGRRYATWVVGLALILGLAGITALLLLFFVLLGEVR